jgi:cytosine deaminase
MQIPGFVSDANPSYWLQAARLPLACLDPAVDLTGGRRVPPTQVAEPWVEAHLQIGDGMIRAILPANQPIADDQLVWNLRQGMVWPAFVDLHTHLDKAHLWPRCPSPDGTFETAIGLTQADRRRHWRAEDLYPRMDFALRCSYAHGTQALRTHLDCDEGQATVSFGVLQRLQREWAGQIALQGVSLVPIETFHQPQAIAIADTVADHGGVLGAVIYPHPGVTEQVERAFELAQERGLDLDFHCDETLDPQAEGLRLVAATKLRLDFTGQVTCGHCCSLALQEADRITDTLDLVRRAQLTVVSLPSCNLYLQDRRAGATPRYRGITLLRELQQAGVAVAIGSDNTRDPFFAYGDHDMVEVFTQAVRIGHLDHPLGDWPRAVGQTPATVMGLGDIAQLGVGSPANLVLFKARSFNELLSRPQGDRTLLRQGRALTPALPDYAELDELLSGG